jgi:UDP-N-acetylglucosamine 2-epimerase
MSACGSRARAANVIDTAGDRAAILSAVRQAVSPAFRASLSGLVNPYGDGHAAEAIVTRLTAVPLDRQLVMKRFIDSKEISA